MDHETHQDFGMKI